MSSSDDEDDDAIDDSSSSSYAHASIVDYLLEMMWNPLFLFNIESPTAAATATFDELPVEKDEEKEVEADKEKEKEHENEISPTTQATRVEPERGEQDEQIGQELPKLDIDIVKKEIPKSTTESVSPTYRLLKEAFAELQLFSRVCTN